MVEAVSEVDGALVCRCGARCSDRKHFGRFKRRHPNRCGKSEEAEAFNQAIADRGTRSVESFRGNAHSMAEEILSLGLGLSAWEREFLASVAQRSEANLSTNQLAKLEEIHAAKVRST